MRLRHYFEELIAVYGPAARISGGIEEIHNLKSFNMRHRYIMPTNVRIVTFNRLRPLQRSEEAHVVEDDEFGRLVSTRPNENSVCRQDLFDCISGEIQKFFDFRERRHGGLRSYPCH